MSSLFLFLESACAFLSSLGFFLVEPLDDFDGELFFFETFDSFNFDLDVDLVTL